MQIIKIGYQEWREDVAPQDVKRAYELDKPQVEDINITAEITAYAFDDVQFLAETVADLLVKVNQLETELEALKNG